MTTRMSEVEHFYSLVNLGFGHRQSLDLMGYEPWEYPVSDTPLGVEFHNLIKVSSNLNRLYVYAQEITLEMLLEPQSCRNYYNIVTVDLSIHQQLLLMNTEYLAGLTDYSVDQLELLGSQTVPLFFILALENPDPVALEKYCRKMAKEGKTGRIHPILYSHHGKSISSELFYDLVLEDPYLLTVIRQTDFHRGFDLCSKTQFTCGHMTELGKRHPEVIEEFLENPCYDQMFKATLREAMKEKYQW